MKKVTFFLLSEKGLDVLKSIINTKYAHIIDFIVIGKDENILNDFSKDIENICKENNLNYKYRTDSFQVSSEYSIAISWRWMLNLKHSKLITLHDSILPKYRGFAPLVNSLINKEKEIGVTALFSTDKYDEGEIIFQEKIEIIYPIRINDAIKIIAKLYSAIVIKLLTEIFFNRKLESHPQNHHNATYSLWRDENDYMVDWKKDAESILQFIYSVGYPFQGAITSLQNGEKFRILECELVDDVKIENRDCGKIIFKENLYPIVVCKTGLLKLTKLVYEENGKDALPVLKFRVKFS